MPEIRVILKSGLLFPQSHPLPLFYSDEMWQKLLKERFGGEPKWAELAYFQSILGNTGTQKRKALLLPSFVCQFPRDGLLIQIWRKWQTIHRWSDVKRIYLLNRFLTKSHTQNTNKISSTITKLRISVGYVAAWWYHRLVYVRGSPCLTDGARTANGNAPRQRRDRSAKEIEQRRACDLRRKNERRNRSRGGDGFDGNGRGGLGHRVQLYRRLGLGGSGNIPKVVVLLPHRFHTTINIVIVVLLRNLGRWGRWGTQPAIRPYYNSIMPLLLITQ